jgi:hypothetical protein
MGWRTKDQSRAGDIEVPINTESDHYVIVFPDGDIIRTYPLHNQLTQAEEKFKEILIEGLLIRGVNGMLEYINIPIFDWAYVSKVEMGNETSTHLNIYKITT